ncbi:MAG: MBOAT family O-acyltransferase [Oscillospiraceae bacterium]
MLFSSITFLYMFLPIVLVLYFITPRKFKNYVLLLSSLVFYFFGEPVYVLLLVFSSLSDYIHSLIIEKTRGTKKAKIALISSIIINLGLLGFFKYADFFIGSVNSLLGASIPLVNVPLPIGISFFTFQTMSYTIDVYRGKAHAEKNLATLATFVCLFPQLIAGPIVRYTDISAELHERRTTMDDLYLGVRRFVVGLGKKVLIANAMGELCAIFRDSTDKSVAFFWLYAIAFTLQIYFDFSGYSDMAIGLGHMFGFKFPENFDYPFTARSITEFWRRWHMTLGGWFRDYLYIPLGGNKVAKWKWYRNIAIVWICTGLWHGAAWNFVIWGGMFGVLLILEKRYILKFLDKTGKAFPHIYLMLIIILSFVVFNADGLSGVVYDFAGLFGAGGFPAWSFETGYYLKSYAVLIVLAIIGSTPLIKSLWAKITATRLGQKAALVLEPLAIAALLACVTAYLVDGSFNPFLYFRF